MPHWISVVAQGVLDAIKTEEGWSVLRIRKELGVQLDRIDPDLFVQEGQAEFIQLRQSMKVWVQNHTMREPAVDEQSVRRLISLFELYYQPVQRSAPIRELAFMSDTQLREIAERDYLDLNSKLIPSKQWKSSVIMAGSILEAILHDRLSHLSRSAPAIASPKAKGKGADIAKWRLETCIDVSVAIGALPENLEKVIHQTLRDYRNFVHPIKELKEAMECGETEAGLAKHALDAVCNHCDANP